MGLAPTAWGPHVWAAIHVICLGAPDRIDDVDREVYRNFFDRLSYVLPCYSCQVHLRENLEALPIPDSVRSARELFAWSVELHNRVNQQTRKPTVSVEWAEDHWQGVLKKTLAPPAAVAPPAPPGHRAQRMAGLAAFGILAFVAGALLAALVVRPRRARA